MIMRWMACDMEKSECKNDENKKTEIAISTRMNSVHKGRETWRQGAKRLCWFERMTMIMSPMNQLNQILLDFSVHWNKSNSTVADDNDDNQKFSISIRAYWLNLITTNEYNISFGLFFFFFYYFFGNSIYSISRSNANDKTKRNEMRVMIRERQCHWSKSIVLVNQWASTNTRPPALPSVCFHSILNSILCECVCWIHILCWWCMCLSLCALPCRALLCIQPLFMLISQFFPSTARTWMNEWTNDRQHNFHVYCLMREWTQSNSTLSPTLLSASVFFSTFIRLSNNNF